MEASCWSRRRERKVATVPLPQERVKAMPKLHSAKTVAWGLERWGKLVDTVVVHSDNWSWRDMACSGHYGLIQHLYSTERACLAAQSKTLPPKAYPSPRRMYSSRCRASTQFRQSISTS